MEGGHRAEKPLGSGRDPGQACLPPVWVRGRGCYFSTAFPSKKSNGFSLLVTSLPHFPAHSTGLSYLLCWVVFPWTLPAALLPAFFYALSQWWGILLSQDAIPSTSCEYSSDLTSSLPSPAYHFLLLPVSIYISLASARVEEPRFLIQHLLHTGHCAEQFTYII